MRVVTVASQTLFEVALCYLGDATAWELIAAENGITDPWLSGIQTLRLPDPPVSSGAGGGQQ